jgi:hypothetical protein
MAELEKHDLIESASMYYAREGSSSVDAIFENAPLKPHSLHLYMSTSRAWDITSSADAFSLFNQHIGQLLPTSVFIRPYAWCTTDFSALDFLTSFAYIRACCLSSFTKSDTITSSGNS